MLGRSIPWFRLLAGLILAALGLWLVFRETSLTAVKAALQQAQLGYVALALLVIVGTGAVKSWRWQLLYYPQSPLPSYSALFWSLHLGQLVNSILPFLRAGDLVRIIDVDRRTRVGKSRTLGTLVVEKVLEMITLALTVLIMVPFLVVPSFVRDSGLVVAATGLFALIFLWLIAYETPIILRVTTAIVKRFPRRIAQRLMPILVSGLGGLVALRSKRAVAGLLGSSVLVGIMYVLTPAILFRALNIDLGLVEGAAIHSVLSIGTLPSWAPANVGVFEFLVAYMLRFFDEGDGGVILAYTIVFHLVVLLPQIILGGIAAIKGSRLESAMREAAQEGA
jgi:uncharacterized protein (TIRG00374 family)